MSSPKTAASVAGSAGLAADRHGDGGSGRWTVEVDQRVAGAVVPVAVRVAVGAGRGVRVGLVGVHVDVVLVVLRVVDAGRGRAPRARLGCRAALVPGRVGGRLRVVAGQGGGDALHDRRGGGEDAQFPVVVQAGDGEVLRPDQDPLVRAACVGDDRLGVDV